MKQLNAQSLQELLAENKERPFIIEDFRITGNIKKIKLYKINFVNCQFFNFDSSGLIFSECTFSDVRFTHSNFTHTQFVNCIISDSTIFNTEFDNSLIATSKFANVVSSKVVFKQTSIQYTRFICNSLIATLFSSSALTDVFFEYNTLDASTFEKTTVYNSVFRSSNMRGIDIVGCSFENTSMDYINFDDVVNINPSEFFIPTKFTNIKNNSNASIALTNSNLKKTFKEFVESGKVASKKQKNFSIPKPKKELQIPKLFSSKERSAKSVENPVISSSTQHLHHEHKKPKKHLFPHHLSARNIGSLLTFFLQAILTLITVLLFKKFDEITQNIFYKPVPNIIEFPWDFVVSSIEMHKFAFYFSLLYFASSGILLCVNVACIRGIRNLLLTWLYRFQSVVTLVVLFWLWSQNIAMQSMFISFFNLLFAFYFFIMFVQSFNTTNRGEPQEA